MKSLSFLILIILGALAVTSAYAQGCTPYIGAITINVMNSGQDNTIAFNQTAPREFKQGGTLQTSGPIHPNGQTGTATFSWDGSQFCSGTFANAFATVNEGTVMFIVDASKGASNAVSFNAAGSQCTGQVTQQSITVDDSQHSIMGNIGLILNCDAFKK